VVCFYDFTHCPIQHKQNSVIVSGIDINISGRPRCLPRWPGLGWHRREATDDLADIDLEFRVDVAYISATAVRWSSVMVLRMRK